MILHTTRQKPKNINQEFESGQAKGRFRRKWTVITALHWITGLDCCVKLLGTMQSIYRKISNIRHQIRKLKWLSSRLCSCLWPIHWSQVLSWEWRGSWSSADRRCSNYIWVINNAIANWCVTYIRGLAVHWNYVSKKKTNESLAYLVTFITNLPSTAWSLTTMTPKQEQFLLLLTTGNFHSFITNL